MVTEEQVRKIALFFLFAYADEKVALEAAHKAVSTYKALQMNRGKTVAQNQLARLQSVDAISAIRRVHQSFGGALRGAASRAKGIDDRAESTESHAQSPLQTQVDLTAWNKFRQDASEVEATAVILSKILKFEDEAIASGLNISLGTARYRIGKGTKALGVFLKQQSSRKTV